MSIKAFRRYEKKYILTKNQFEILICELEKRMDFDMYCQDCSSYSIYNIYLDTLNNDVIRECVNYPEYKEKMRIRSYKKVKENDIVFLELKRKINGITTKRRVPLTYKEAKEFINGKDIEKESYIEKQIIKEMKYYLVNHPVVFSTYLSYERIALFGKQDKTFRITFDKNITTRRDNINLSDDYGQKLIDDDQYIMEIKIDKAIPLWLVEKLSELKIFSTSFSKYGQEYKTNIVNTYQKNKWFEKEGSVYLNG